VALNFFELFQVGKLTSVVSAAVVLCIPSLPSQAQERENQQTNSSLFYTRFLSGVTYQETSNLEHLNESQIVQRMPAVSDNQPDQVIRLRLDVSGEQNEWIRIETRSSNNGEVILTAYHTERIRRSLLSDVATGVLGFGLAELANEVIDGYEGPVPTPGINLHRWDDHETRRIVFIPDGCLGDTLLLPNSTLPSCVIVGTDSITLPIRTNIYSGLFILEYQEKELLRTITFRIDTEDS
jgi:hypothetical protein